TLPPLLRLAVPLCLAAPLAAQTLDTAAFGSLTWRNLGPQRGGRSVAVAGSSSRPNEYYMGTTGGGVFKTTDGGQGWAPVSDKYFGGTVGAIAVSESNPDVVYAGGGEFPIRGNVSHGDGVYKTTDGGKTWVYVGLVETRQVAKIRIHPRNPDIAYVAAFGPVWGPSPARGVFKTTDGGKTWSKVLFRNDSTGAIDLSMDPSNPDVLYAGLWQAYRKPWVLVSGGPGSGLFKSTDAGRTWKEITRHPGLPAGIIGNVGISVSPANPKRVYAIVEADSGGVYRSDDGGDTWARMNDERKLRQRAWYYTRIFADPRDENTVYVDNVQLWRSTDGGRTFPRPINTPHGDHHDLWIAPNDPRRLGSADDGGVAISTDGGQHWTDLRYPTAQFYHVTTTNHFPYRVCGAQQDNSTACLPSKAVFGSDLADFYDAGGGESGYIAVRPDDPDIMFAGSYGGFLTRKDTRSGIERDVNPWPLNPMGHSAGDLKYRFQWTFPIVISPHDPKTLYAGANVVFQSTDEGGSWTAISPDLTRHDPATLGPSGGPITKDQTSVEYYGTVFTIAESPVEKGVIWTGSDDGMVYVKPADGNWLNVTPKDLPEWTRISMVEASPHARGAAYVAGNRYQLNDNAPYLWKTTDYGKSWTRIVTGISAGEFVRVVREDPVRRGLLFAGTERGVWVSFDDGARWQRLQRNLPPVPVHDLAVKEGDLVAATHGRAFWILDDISVLRQLAAEQLQQDARLYKPRDTWRIAFSFGGASSGWDGASVQYWLKKGGQKLTLDFLDAKGAVIRSFSSEQDSLARADSLRGVARRAEADAVARRLADSLAALGVLPGAVKPDSMIEPPRQGFHYTPPPRVPNKPGMNRFNWNLRAPEPAAFEGLIMWAAGVSGPVIPPGAYSVRLTAGDKSETQPFAVLKDPRSSATQADLDAQYEFLVRVRDKTSEANNAVRTIRNVKAQLADRKKRAGTRGTALERVAASLEGRLSQVEGEIYQVKNRSGQDPLNYPIKLNNQIAALLGLAGGAEARPTSQSVAVFRLLSEQLDAELKKLGDLLGAGIGEVNAELTRLGLDRIAPSPAEIPPS
ncbi:MAG TPA: glycosyl hydrolase, partial [Gemmatimonadales bacterium]|nr:glycosyl hydrolase [Gemmatimonadales bacterium]